MKEAIKKALLTVNFAGRYIDLCNRFVDFNNRGRFKKNDVQEILSKMNTDLKYSSRESLFLKDYEIGSVTIRIIIPYKTGMIDCSYAIWTEGFKERVNDSFFEIALIQDPDAESKIQAYKFPVATSKVEFEIILRDIIVLHNNFITEYSKLLCFDDEE